jgi:hypothetical protein
VADFFLPNFLTPAVQQQLSIGLAVGESIAGLCGEDDLSGYLVRRCHGFVVL